MRFLLLVILVPLLLIPVAVIGFHVFACGIQKGHCRLAGAALQLLQIHGRTAAHDRLIQEFAGESPGRSATCSRAAAPLLRKEARVSQPSLQDQSIFMTPIRCPHCGGEAFVMSRIADPRHVGGEIRTFECVSCERETEMRLQGEP